MRLLRLVLRPYVALPLVVLAGVVLWATAPWTLFIDEVVDEALPRSVATVAPAGTSSPSGVPSTGNVLLASGTFVSHEHGTTGKAEVLGLPDGSRVLRLIDLDTSNGPDLKVWITDAPVLEGRRGWFVFDDGKYVDLGGLKGNRGSQNYVLPDRVDLSALTSVSIWCERFRVSFGAVELRPA